MAPIIERSSSCRYCKETLYLNGYDWESPTENAAFAFEIIATIVLLICLFLPARFTWVREKGHDRLRNSGYVVAVLFTLLYFITTVVDTGLREANKTTTYSYEIMFIFTNLGWRVSELLILAIVLRTIIDKIALNVSAVLLLACLSAASFFMFIAEIASLLGGNGRDRLLSLFQPQEYVDIAYRALYLLIVSIAFITTLILVIRERSKGSFIMLFVVVPLLFLRNLINLVYSILISFPLNVSLETEFNFGAANTFIYSIATAGIFLGVAIIACLRPSGFVRGVLQESKSTA